MERPIWAFVALVLALTMIGALAIEAYAAEPHSIEETFERAAWAYRLDPDLLIAIATLESGYGTSKIAQNYNNWFGWMRNNGEPMAFETAEKGIWHVARAISRRPHGTLEEIADWYNPCFKEIWLERVSAIFERRVSKNEQNDGAGN